MSEIEITEIKSAKIEKDNEDKADCEARKIIKGLNEAQQIQSGEKDGTAFDDFLKEL